MPWRLFSEIKVWVAISCYRIINALLLGTYFNPDEYWQAQEVAHKEVYGYGEKTWERDPNWAIRGYAHPTLVAIIPYSLMKLLGIDSAFLVQWMPRIIHAVFVPAVIDLFIWKMAQRMWPERTARVPTYALLLSLTSWFSFYTLPRLFSNSMETALCLLAVYFLPDPARLLRPETLRFSSYFLSFFLASASIIIRPTAIIFWLPVALFHLVYLRSFAALLQLLRVALSAIAIPLVLSCFLDFHFYGHFVFVPYNFFSFNVGQNLAGFYGIHAWHWYLSNALPTMLFTYLPFFLYGIYTFLSNERTTCPSLTAAPNPLHP